MIARVLVLLWSALALLTPAAAEQPAAESEQPPWYEAEVIVFAHSGVQRHAEENWPDTPGMPPLAGAVDLYRSTPVPSVALRAVEPSRLTDERRHLERSGAYEVLAHMAWQQPGLAREEAVPVLVYEGMRANDGAASRARLHGTLALGLARYLHLQADLLYQPAATSAPAADTPAQPVPVADALTVRMQQSRRMRSEELHYLDHPLFGVLALVTPVDAPEAAPTSPSTPPTPSAQPAEPTAAQ